MITLQPKLIPDMERIVEFDLVRATDAAVLRVSATQTIQLRASCSDIKL